MRIESEILLDFKDVLIRPKRSTLTSRKEVSLQRSYTFKHSNYNYTGVPIIASNMDGVGTPKMAIALDNYNMMTCLTKFYNIEPEKLSGLITTVRSSNLSISMGTSEVDFNQMVEMLETHPTIQFICIDVANGYTEHFGNFVARVREFAPNKTIIAGNVVTADMTQELILRGADIVKVGIGPSPVCTTRVKTGVGYPQLSAIIECADAAHGLGAHIIADGGCSCPGDIAKAFGAGADFVMLGTMLAGHDEGEGVINTKLVETTELLNSVSGVRVKKEVKTVTFWGMSSDTAMMLHHGGVAEYRASEGRTVEVPYKGSVHTTVLDILGGLRSACTYTGAVSLKQLSKCTTFVRVNRQISDQYAK